MEKQILHREKGHERHRRHVDLLTLFLTGDASTPRDAPAEASLASTGKVTCVRCIDGGSPKVHHSLFWAM